jgi:hypothetical protein
VRASCAWLADTPDRDSWQGDRGRRGEQTIRRILDADYRLLSRGERSAAAAAEI